MEITNLTPRAGGEGERCKVTGREIRARSKMEHNGSEATRKTEKEAKCPNERAGPVSENVPSYMLSSIHSCAAAVGCSMSAP